MRVDWKIKGPPIPRWQYGFVPLALLSCIGYLVWKGRSDLWISFGFQLAFLLAFLVIAKRVNFPFASGFIEFDGERLDFKGNAGGRWSLADVDSVVIQDGLIQIRLYRAGGMGDEFTVRAKLMAAEDWEKLTALCRRIEAAISANGDADLREARCRAKELDEHPEAGCSWKEIKTSLGR